MPVQLSNQIYILGMGPNARYLAHRLGGCPDAPAVRILLEHRSALRRDWEACEQSITLHTGDEAAPTAQRNVEIEWTGPRPFSTYRDELIYNLIITLPPGQTLRILRTLRHRIGRHTTICLMHDGLGVSDSINEALFRDPNQRPTYVLGHMTHTIYKTSRFFSIQEHVKGKVYLNNVFRDGTAGDGLVSRQPPGDPKMVKHLCGLFSRTPGLTAGGHDTRHFLMWKLPMLAYKSIADPITLNLGCSYEDLIRNQYARQMVHDALGEIGQVVRQLPSLKGSVQAEKLVREGRLTSQVWQLIYRHRNETESALNRVYKGQEPDIDYQTGYFVDQGRKMGIPCPVSRSLLWTAKTMQSSQAAKGKSLNGDGSIPFARRKRNGA